MATQHLRIGFDFDNTIVCYDEAIAVMAEQMFTLPHGLPRTKLALRNHLRAAGLEPEWTAFQGALYGPGMEHAEPFEGAIETMQMLVDQGHQLTIVSHRSRRPYAGPPHDLHAAAIKWIEERLQSAGLFMPVEKNFQGTLTVNFLESREAKVARIAALQCQMFVDDLPEVLAAPDFPNTAIGVLFDPDAESTCERSLLSIANWRQLLSLLENLP
jgi:hypothetical protein